MATINPGQLALYATFVLTIFSVLFSIMFQRPDSIVLGAGIGLLAYGTKLPAAYILLISALAIFLSSYLPFGQSSGYLIQGFNEGFTTEDITEPFAKKKAAKKKGGKKASKKSAKGKSKKSKDKSPKKAAKKAPESDDEESENDENDEESGSDEDDEEGDDEGFSSENDKEEFSSENANEGFSSENVNEDFNSDKDSEGFSDSDDEGFDSDTEGFVSAEFNPGDTFEGFASAPKKKRRLPDNGSRAEMFELGKEYKMPKETDDPDYHLDAGTTFMNAYKSLKPDQVSAMTKDTQDLINTQKQLMATLNTLKPLITDGKQMMDTFQNYFGADGGAGNVGDLAKLAEKFAPKA